MVSLVRVVAPLVAVVTVATACGGEKEPEPPLCSQRSGVRGTVFIGTDPVLSGGAVEYPVALETDLALQQGVAFLPAPLPGSGYWIAARDVSEDVFLYVVREVDGLTPGAAYRARFCATVATPLHVGGYGQHVYMKLGVSDHVPSKIVVDSDYGPFFLLDIDKGRASRSGGADAVYAGEVGREDGERGWALVAREPAEGVTVTADSQGKVWLLAGIESTFGGLVQIYWTELEIELNQI